MKREITLVFCFLRLLKTVILFYFILCIESLSYIYYAGVTLTSFHVCMCAFKVRNGIQGVYVFKY